MALSPDGQLLAATHKGDWKLRLWDPKTGGLRRTLERDGEGTDRYYAVDFSPDGRRVIGLGHTDPVQVIEENVVRFRQGGGIITIWDVATGGVRGRDFIEGAWQFYDCFFNRPGKILFAHFSYQDVPGGSSHEAVRAWWTGTKQTKAFKVPIEKEEAPSDLRALLVSRHFPFQATTSRDSASLIFRIKKPLTEPGRAAELAVHKPALKGKRKSNRAERPVAANLREAKSQLVITDLTTGKERGRLELTPELDSSRNYLCALSPDGKKLCLSTAEPKGLLFWDVASGEKHRPGEPPSVRALDLGRYSPDGSKLALGHGSGVVI
jgi:WD40 repeat protein